MIADVLINLALLLLFAVQHSGMARPGFKLWLARFVPARYERLLYAIASALCLALAWWCWRRIPFLVWDARSPLLRGTAQAISAAGLAIVVWAASSMGGWELLGLPQLLRGDAYRPMEFRQPWLYRQVRHPVYSGTLLALWSAPTLDGTRALLAVFFTGYILLAIRWEERDLLRRHGEPYARYRERVPALVPRVRLLRGAPDSAKKK